MLAVTTFCLLVWGGFPLLVFERKVLEDVLRCQILGNVSGAEERPQLNKLQGGEVPVWI